MTSRHLFSACLLGIFLSSISAAAERKVLPQLIRQAADNGIAVPAPPSSGPGRSVIAAAPIDAAKYLRSAGAGGEGKVMMQGFHWESHQSSWWGIVAAKAQDIGRAGFDMVWLPPSSAAMSDEGYLPNRLYVQDSAYGSQAQLRRAIGALHGAGVQVLADIVINHRVGTTGWADFTEPAWGPDSITSDDECGQVDECPNPTGNPDTGKGYHAARDIDHTNPAVQRSLIDWLNWLRRDIGYDGWRYDYVRGYAPKYLAMYQDATAPTFAVGEIWDDLDLGNPNAHRQAAIDWIDSVGGKSAVFDFTTKGILQQAVRAGEYWRLNDGAGRPPGLIGWWSAKAVTFIDNHDTGASTGGAGQNHWPFPGAEIMQGYAYILTHPGIPCVYWPHYFDWGIQQQLKDLVFLRKEAGINENSAVEIKAADGARYAAIIDGRLAMKIGPGSWSPGPGWTLRAHGRNYAAWTR